MHTHHTFSNTVAAVNGTVQKVIIIQVERSFIYYHQHTYGQLISCIKSRESKETTLESYVLAMQIWLMALCGDRITAQGGSRRRAADHKPFPAGVTAFSTDELGCRCTFRRAERRTDTV